MTIAVFAAVLLAQGAAAAPVDVAYEALAVGDDRAAVMQLEASAPAGDPAVLINLGVAYARQGDRSRARDLFERAIAASERYDLETASGAWVDSRALAFKALAALERGAFDEASATRTALR